MITINLHSADQEGYLAVCKYIEYNKSETLFRARGGSQYFACLNLLDKLRVHGKIK